LLSNWTKFSKISTTSSPKLLYRLCH